MEGILAGRSDYAAALVDLGFVSHSYCRGINDGQVDSWPLGPDEYSDNARIVKAALCAGTACLSNLYVSFSHELDVVLDIAKPAT